MLFMYTKKQKLYYLCIIKKRTDQYGIEVWYHRIIKCRKNNII